MLRLSTEEISPPPGVKVLKNYVKKATQVIIQSLDYDDHGVNYEHTKIDAPIILLSMLKLGKYKQDRP
jgi:hypothetical protein